MKTIEYSREDLLDVLKSYRGMIERYGTEYPTVCLSDLYASITYVLKRNGTSEREEE